MTIAELQESVHEVALDKGWYEEPRTFGDLIALVHSELSEALEAFRGGFPKAIHVVYYPEGEGTKPEGVGVELADAVIRIMDMCHHYKIDLEEMILLKHEYNKSRPHRHGGKAI